MAGIAKRDVGPILNKVRAFLLGQNRTNALRFEHEVADRTTPPPNLPDGPAHILSTNYYVNRDGRREVAPPINLKPKQKLLEGSADSQLSQAPTPGKVFRWD